MRHEERKSRLIRSTAAVAVERADFAVRAGALALAIGAGILIYLALIRVLSPADLKSVAGLVRKSIGEEKP
jgi:hypothetical protein